MSCDDLCFLRSRGRHCASAATLIASHLATHNTSVVSRPSRTSTLKSTKNNADTNWNANVDLFDKGVLAVVWYLLGSKALTPGRYTNPNLGKDPPIDTKASVTNKAMHFSVREKMEQLANSNAKVAKDVTLVSKTLDGF